MVIIFNYKYKGDDYMNLKEILKKHEMWLKYEKGGERANLRNANLRNAKTNMNTIGYNLACPEKGSFIGYKKANGCIIELLILEDAKRSSATTMKCRCNKAKVLDIRDIGTGDKINVVKSNYDHNFIYEVGEVVSVNDFDDDRWNECSTGIHFFMNRENALKY